jgi:beta-1,4-mannosyltransferase
MKKAYIYPVTFKEKVIANPYIQDFICCLSDHIHFLNRDRPSKYGIFDIFRYIHQINLLFLNWPEDLPDKKGGLIQALTFFLIIFLARLKRIQIFYTLHNRESHKTRFILIKKSIRWILFRKADYILTHSSSGIELLPDQKTKEKALYLPHPFSIKPIVPAKRIKEKEYDILIWGTVQPYKGVDAFLSYCRKNIQLGNLKILVAGIISPDSYVQCITQFASPNIKIINRYINDEDLVMFIEKSRIVLFTYLKDSVLSSGALVFSMQQKALILGPDTGAFHDMYQEGLIEVYHDHNSLYEKIQLLLNNRNSYLIRSDLFITENTWSRFSEKILHWLEIR